MTDRYQFAQKHRTVVENSIQRMRAKRRKGEDDPSEDAAIAVSSALLALADEIGELRLLFKNREAP